MLETPRRSRRIVRAFAFTGYLCCFGWACVSVPQLAEWLSKHFNASSWIQSAACVAGWLALALVVAVTQLWFERRPGTDVAILVLGVLPIWGLIANQAMTDKCQFVCPGPAPRALACPDVYWLGLFHALTAIGYALSRWRRAGLSAPAERWLGAFIVSGICLHALVGVQLASMLPGLLLFPIFLPVIVPYGATVLLVAELARHWRYTPAEGIPPRWRVSELAQAIARAPLLLGAYALIQGLVRGRVDGALDVVTRTCGHPLSNIPLQVVREQCGGHYLCTVAAHGHPALVRPLRLGRRRGEAIVVNRQLAIANAFEDLLHTRWPRIGRLARATYDRLAIPVCRFITNRWLADLTYLLMKPAELLFYWALLLLDREAPEAHIARMYRA